MNRRASLPGVDELFGAREAPARTSPASSPPPAQAPAEGPSAPPAAHAPAPAASSRNPEPDPGPEPPQLSATGALPAAVQRLTAAEDDAIAAARERATEALSPPEPELGALLRWAVAVFEVRAAVEVGAGGGVSGLWMLRALPPGGVLTSIEPDERGHRLASEALRQADTRARTRSIHGDAATVLPRLSDASYDLVLLQTVSETDLRDLTHAERLLRPGGVLVARGVYAASEADATPSPFLHELFELPGFQCVVLPIAGGVALATRLRDEPV